MNSELLGSVLPIVAPIVLAVLLVLVRAGMNIALTELKKLTNIQVQQSFVDQFEAMVDSKIGAAVAGVEGNLATVAIPVGSPVVKSIVDEILAEAPSLMLAAGITPDSVAKYVQGRIGSWQSNMTSVVIPAAKVG